MPRVRAAEASSQCPHILTPGLIEWSLGSFIRVLGDLGDSVMVAEPPEDTEDAFSPVDQSWLSPSDHEMDAPPTSLDQRR